MWTQAWCDHNVASIWPPGPNDPLLDIGEAGSGRWDASLIRSTLQEISPSLIIIAVSYPSWYGLNHNDATDEVECHCHVTGVPYLQVDADGNIKQSLSTHVWG